MAAPADLQAHLYTHPTEPVFQVFVPDGWQQVKVLPGTSEQQYTAAGHA